MSLRQGQRKNLPLSLNKSSGHKGIFILFVMFPAPRKDNIKVKVIFKLIPIYINIISYFFYFSQQLDILGTPHFKIAWPTIKSVIKMKKDFFSDAKLY